MKNKEFLNICYKFFNRFITADLLIEKLNNMDTKNLSKNEKNNINNLIKEISEIEINTPNEIDEYVIKKKKSVNEIIKKVDNILKDTIPEGLLNKYLTSLKIDYDKEMDSHDRWFKIFDCISNNEYFNNCFNSLSDYELLEFIAQYIEVPYPPILNQEEFERLVKVGIKHDEREWLWRLALNYEQHNINFDSIVDYFIKMKDGYYIAELISMIGECLDIDLIIDKINDQELINDLKMRKSIMSSYINDEQFNKLISKLEIQ